MNAVDLDHLGTLYADGDDPWGFRSSPYEQAKFRATRAALARPGFGSALELGCGNGELARHIAPICARYTGVDAVDKALQAARRAVPGGRFEQLFLPAPRPEVVDTIGAGDTFNAGVLAALHAEGRLNKSALAGIGKDAMATALALGIRAAAVTVSRAGANPPMAEDLA